MTESATEGFQLQRSTHFHKTIEMGLQQQESFMTKMTRKLYGKGRTFNIPGRRAIEDTTGSFDGDGVVAADADFTVGVAPVDYGKWERTGTNRLWEIHASVPDHVKGFNAPEWDAYVSSELDAMKASKARIQDWAMLTQMNKATNAGGASRPAVLTNIALNRNGIALCEAYAIDKSYSGQIHLVVDPTAWSELRLDEYFASRDFQSVTYGSVTGHSFNATANIKVTCFPVMGQANDGTANLASLKAIQDTAGKHVGFLYDFNCVGHSQPAGDINTSGPDMYHRGTWRTWHKWFFGEVVIQNAGCARVVFN